jgi:hypothetical protein
MKQRAFVWPLFYLSAVLFSEAQSITDFRLRLDEVIQ